MKGGYGEAGRYEEGGEEEGGDIIISLCGLGHSKRGCRRTWWGWRGWRGSRGSARG